VAFGRGKWQGTGDRGQGTGEKRHGTRGIVLIRTFRDLVVWQEAMKLVEMVYLQTKRFPKEEIYGLTSQIRRAAVSIPANIAEGNGRKSRKEYLQFLWIAHGSITELETHILISERLKFMTKEEAQQLKILLQSVGNRLRALIKSLTTPIP